jgi:4-amino-4-deoxy-L-arabinose transferase-like glycosyltransferase
VMFKFFNAPHEPWVIRLPAAVAGVLTVLGVYLLVAELFSSGALGLLSAFLVATSFWHINFSRIGFRAIFAPLLLAWALYLLLKAFKTPSSRTAAWYAVIAGIVYSLGFYTYIAYRVTPLLFLLFIPFFKKYSGFWKRVLIFVVVTFIVAAPIGWYFVKNPANFFGRTSEISVTNSGNPIGHFAVNLGKTLLMFNGHGDDNWRHNVSGEPELFWPVGILFILGIGLGTKSLWQSRWKHNLEAFALLTTFLWFILTMLPAAVSDEGLPHALRSILILPPAMIFAALGGMWVYNGIIKKQGGLVIAKIFVAFFIGGVAASAYAQYFTVWAVNPNVQGAFSADYVEIGRAINHLPMTTPKYVVVEAGGVMTRGIPMPAETTIYITDSFLPEQQTAKNIHYLLPDQTNTIPPGTPSSTIFYIR